LSDEREARRRRRRAARQGVAEPEAPAADSVDIGTVPEARSARHRRSAASRVFYSLFVIFALAGLTALGVAAFGYEQYIGAGPLPAPKVVEVRKGLRTPDIAADLESAGVISDAKVFTAAAYLTGSRGRLKAGEYQFTAGMSMRDVLGLIVQGKSIVYKLTIPEGWTTEQALERVRDNEILTGELTLSPPEGGIFPDTYVFKRGATRDTVVRDMMDAQKKLIDDLWEKRAPDLVVKSVNEAVTLASIVEKETGIPEERPRVAAVFINRLKQRMRLQSDPTIIYGLVGGKGKLDRPLTKQDIAAKTPYNTYRIDGLPPGPIANPGRAALKAVLTPAVTSELYFVADGSGGHAFAETLADHRKNVAKWRAVERERNADEGDFVDELAAEKAGEDIGPPKPEAAAAANQATTAKPPEPQIPPGTAITETTGSTGAGGEEKVVTPELPPIEDQPQTAENTGKPAEATKPPATDEPAPASEPKEEAQAVPEPPPPEPKAQAAAEPPPAEPKMAPSAVESVPPDATKNPADAAKKVEEAAAAAAETVPLPRSKPRQPPKPGDLIKVANRLVPIPVPKPRLP
jgi:UPF0755 protein